ncbi:MAG TPA: protein-L-isoaspartate(D-aspartate) O-methyltransferase [Anaerolineae bacterium]|nr:protein-L-isoaspartate(D-aspartate) O-methyltransferase [Anaerolineae bacterium]
MKKDKYRQARERMVEQQLRTRGISDERVLQVMRSVPRHLFVDPDLRYAAYSDAPLPIPQQQTISQPYIVALMTELLELKGGERVLEVGTGSGYQAAVLAHIAGKVYTLERIHELVVQAEKTLSKLGLDNVEVFEVDGTLGLPEHAPYEAIIVTAAAPHVPEPLKQQLGEGGRLVLPVGSRMGQMLERWRRTGDDFSHERLAPVAFVPLVGDHGWKDDERRTAWWI